MAMDLTRRDLVARGAAAAGALMAGSLLAPRMVFAGEAGEAVVSTRLPRSGRIETTRAFDLIGIEAPAAAHPEVRARGVDGRWTDWLPVHLGESHGPDAGGSAERESASRLSDPVWTG